MRSATSTVSSSPTGLRSMGSRNPRYARNPRPAEHPAAYPRVGEKDGSDGEGEDHGKVWLGHQS
jgi:hypothetical protein